MEQQQRDTSTGERRKILGTDEKRQHKQKKREARWKGQKKLNLCESMWSVMVLLFFQLVASHLFGVFLSIICVGVWCIVWCCFWLVCPASLCFASLCFWLLLFICASAAAKKSKGHDRAQPDKSAKVKTKDKTKTKINNTMSSNAAIAKHKAGLETTAMNNGVVVYSWKMENCTMKGKQRIEASLRAKGEIWKWRTEGKRGQVYYCAHMKSSSISPPAAAYSMLETMSSCGWDTTAKGRHRIWTKPRDFKHTCIHSGVEHLISALLTVLKIWS